MATETTTEFYDLIVVPHIRFPGAIRGEVKVDELEALAQKLLGETNLPGEPTTVWIQAIKSEGDA